MPHYVATAAEPEGDARAPRRGSRQLLDLGLELTDLDIAASAWERSVDEVVAGDADVELVRRAARARATTNGRRRAGWLDTDDEIAVVDDDDDEDWLDEDDLPSGESLAEDFERYLRDQREE